MLQAVRNWFAGPSKSPAPPAQAPPPWSADLGGRLDRIEAELRELRTLPLDWQEVLDKLQAWTNRQNARLQKRVQAGLTELGETRQDAPSDTIPPQAGGDRQAVKIALRRRYQAQQGGVG